MSRVGMGTFPHPGELIDGGSLSGRCWYLSLDLHLHGWVSVLSAGFVQEVTACHTYCV